MRKTREQKEKLAKLLADEVPITKALETAGWSPLQARKGWKAVPRDVFAILPKKAKALIEKGKIDKKDMEHLLMGRLVENITKGKDGGSQSAKILGSHRDINLWTPEQMQGLIVLQAPQSLIERKDEILNAEE